MAIYKTLGGLRNAMQRALVQSVNNASTEIQKRLKDRADLWYADYSPTQYERTNELPAHFIIQPASQGSGEVSGEVRFDGSYTYDTGSFPSGEEVMEAADLGLHGAMGLHTEQGNRGIQLWTDTMEEIERESRSIWGNALRSAGFDII